MEVVGGTDEILKDTCSEPITELALKDEFHGSAKVGPYTYLVGIDSETGIIIEGKPCTDSMSGESFQTTVTLRLGEQTLEGCGRALF